MAEASGEFGATEGIGLLLRKWDRLWLFAVGLVFLAGFVFLILGW